MKRRSILDAVALTVIAAAWCGGLAFGSTVKSSRIPLDARFILDGERDLRGWIFNKVESYKPWGDVRAVMLEGRPGVGLHSKGKPTTVYYDTPIAVKAGDALVVKANVRGKGCGSIGFFAYGAKWAWKGSHGMQFRDVADAAGVPVQVEKRYVVPEGVVTLRPTLSVTAGGDVEFFDVMVEKEDGTDDAKRPYEMVWAGRTADANAPALVPFTDPAGWTVETMNAVASMARATDRLLFGDGVTRLTYRSDGAGAPCVTMRPPVPLAITGAFDAVSCWIYGNNFYGRQPDTPSTSIIAHFTDADGKAFTIDLAHIHHREWCIFQKRLPPDIAKRTERGGKFTGLSVKNGTNKADRTLDFCSLCVFKEKFAPLTFAPRARRGVQVFPDQPQGVNTGEGRLPFPTVDTTVVPVVPEDKDIEFRFPEKDGAWDDLAFRYRKGPWIALAKGGGIWPATNASSVKASFRRIGNSVVADIVAKGGDVEEVRFGGAMVGDDAEIVPIPYYTYRNTGVAERPCVISTKLGDTPVFISATVDWTQSSASAPFSARQTWDGAIAANGGVEYIPKTDGKRNDVYERFVWTVSTDFAATLPVIPNPKSQWKHVTGCGIWSAYGASKNRDNDRRYWKNVRRKGLRHVIVTDHETGWRDGDESFTFRTRPAPKKGGDKGQYDYARYMIDTLGFVYGPYNNFTDFAPVNGYWSTDHVARVPQGDLRAAWARCYSPKPLYAVEMCEKLTPIIQGKFRFNTAYCDVHTAVTPWGRTDYDARVPGAAMFAQTFYSYGEIMLIQKRCWNGPVYSEGGCHWPYVGLTDGNYAQAKSYKLPENPWLVDFDLLRMHPLCCNFGVGSPGMFYGDKTIPKDLWEMTDPFVACTIAFGHPPFLLSRNLMYGYFMVQALAARYTQADAESITYADAKGAFHPTSAAVASGDYRRSQISVRYSDGTETIVNGSRDGDWLECRRGNGKLVLPPYGFFGFGNGVCSFYGTRDGEPVAFARGPEYAYMHARGKKWIETPVGGSDGEMVRLFKAGGTEEIIAAGAREMMLPYAAVKIVALDAADAKEIGDVQFTVDGKGRTRFKPQKGAFSYRATPSAGWRDADAAAYAEAALTSMAVPPVKAERVERPIQMPYVWRSGMVLRGSAEELPVDKSLGARIGWSGMANEGVQRRTLTFHPPYRGKTGYVFARYHVKVPAEGAVFVAKTAKTQGSTPGDGILFRALVREKAGATAECVAEDTVKDYVWHDFKADLSRWAGRPIDLILAADPGPADNTYGDGGGWADMHLERLKPALGAGK